MEDRSYLCRNRDLPKIVKKRAKALRIEMTPAEEKLWESLRGDKIDWKFRRQHAIGHLILDFYCHTLLLGIELDGAIHRQPEVRARDAYKTEYMTDIGISLLRFTNDEVLYHHDKVIEYILQVCNNLQNTQASPPVPPLLGERGSGGEGA